MFQRFVHSEVSGSVVLLAATIVALVWANSPWAASYFELQHTYISVSWGEHTFKLSLQHWINDGLMVLFFFVVGLEIKREIVVGQLSSLRKSSGPVAAALASEQAAPISDLRASDRYRRHCIGVMAKRAVDAAARRADGESIAVPVNRSLGIGAA